MTLTAIVAVGISLWFVASYSDTLAQIFTIMLFGLVFDLFNTWITNASILKWFLEGRA
jgi:preprotein translocase subunit SecF